MAKNRFHSLSALMIIFSFVLELAIPSILGASIACAAPEPPQIEAESYLLADFKTERILLSKNTQNQQIPASLTKIMTLYIIFDEISHGNLSLDDEIYISENAWKTEGSKMFVLVDTKVKLEDLIKGITVASGNDACVAVAEHISGNVSSFVNRMNQQAQLLGLSSTYYVDPHGLSDDNRTTAEDVFRLVKAYVTTFPECIKYHSQKEFIYTPPGEHPIKQYNRNTLLSSYEGVYGLKTGYTSKAGFNIVVLADRDGFSTIAIILGAAKGKYLEQGERERNHMATLMLDYAYDNFTYVPIAEPATSLGRVRVWKGKGKWAEAIAPNGLGATVEIGEEDFVSYEVFFDEDLEAPLEKGARIGEVIFTCDGQEIGRTEIVSKETVDKGNVFRVIWDSISRTLSKVFTKT
ncbi:MAG TPA: D-alanyl-D-alanine carboxypeptidase family protein [Bacillota bacterium]|nr:D-alanyl-D-alanine carboxypeptidase [Candidatus Fermentithermobacillaceae bacterium]HOB29974.1 D-alanyl-D-alanine carboxypeptidase family protein [Bacillota bacterium]HOK63845.1 D-alanyl-D-alanine carboxypeptidase family protein [Bacillota bacterium]HOL11467.1 D-alanyl-D-alanine carboxypeptidase family protein [Bacillota bacterium]HOQ03197.1 D-alanyl-D-alanine carboxypeptidase family protein [Bacillota bacterium]